LQHNVQVELVQPKRAICIIVSPKNYRSAASYYLFILHDRTRNTYQ